jgi:hypothetical protein
MCQVKPHHAMMQAKRDTMNLDTTMIAMAWPTERPWVRKVLGVCQVATFKAPLCVCSVQYDGRSQWASRRATYRDCAPKKLNHPQVLLDGGRGTKSRLHHAVVSSLRDESALRIAASLTLRAVAVAIFAGPRWRLGQKRSCTKEIRIKRAR